MPGPDSNILNSAVRLDVNPYHQDLLGTDRYGEPDAADRLTVDDVARAIQHAKQRITGGAVGPISTENFDVAAQDKVTIHLVSKTADGNKKQWLYIMPAGEYDRLSESLLMTEYEVKSLTIDRDDLQYVYEADSIWGYKLFVPDIIGLHNQLRKAKIEAELAADKEKYALYMHLKFHWATALGISIGAADAAWQGMAFVLNGQGSSGFLGIGGTMVTDAMIFVYPVALAAMAGLLYAELLKRQYAAMYNIEVREIPPEISKAYTQQGYQLMAKMFAGVSTFQGIEILLGQLASNSDGELFGLSGSPEVLLLGVIIGAATALAVCMTAYMQDRGGHGAEGTASASFYMALFGAVTFAVMAWVGMESIGADMAMKAVATIGTGLFVAASFTALMGGEQAAQPDPEQDALPLPRAKTF